MKLLTRIILTLLVTFMSFNIFANDINEEGKIAANLNVQNNFENKIASELEPITNKPISYFYARIGYCGFLAYIPGAETALGFRKRTDHFSHGFLINVSGFVDIIPYLSVKYEGLYFPMKFSDNNFYFGLMPGITFYGIIPDSGERSLFPIPTLEILFGQEFISKNKKPSFYYVSISSFLVLSLNYGWSF